MTLSSIRPVLPVSQGLQILFIHQLGSAEISVTDKIKP
jgi:hypothetical protein